MLQRSSIRGSWSISALRSISSVGPLAPGPQLLIMMNTQPFQELRNRYAAPPLWVIPVRMKTKRVTRTERNTALGSVVAALPQLGVYYLVQN